jgi:hypothetical protein|tara:strand:+ start:90841 stop:90981 length:141 start_codon:yes stop_codon:yes gene_type:complete
MTDKKEILNLLKNISDGDYAKARGNVKTVVESKISGRIKTILKKTK